MLHVKQMIPDRLMTGVSNFARENNDNYENAEALFLTFIDHVLKTADRYTTDAGRNTITTEDMLYAMKYEAHVFFHHPDTHDDFQKYRAWHDEGEEDDEEEESEDEDADDDEFCRCTVTQFCQRVNGIVDAWGTWSPSDPAQQSMKRAIDAIKMSTIEE